MWQFWWIRKQNFLFPNRQSRRTTTRFSIKWFVRFWPSCSKCLRCAIWVTSQPPNVPPRIRKFITQNGIIIRWIFRSTPFWWWCDRNSNSCSRDSLYFPARCQHSRRWVNRYMFGERRQSPSITFLFQMLQFSASVYLLLAKFDN